MLGLYSVISFQNMRSLQIKLAFIPCTNILIILSFFFFFSAETVFSKKMNSSVYRLANLNKIYNILFLPQGTNRLI